MPANPKLSKFAHTNKNILHLLLIWVIIFVIIFLSISTYFFVDSYNVINQADKQNAESMVQHLADTITIEYQAMQLQCIRLAEQYQTDKEGAVNEMLQSDYRFFYYQSDINKISSLGAAAAPDLLDSFSQELSEKVSFEPSSYLAGMDMEFSLPYYACRVSGTKDYLVCLYGLKSLTNIAEGPLFDNSRLCIKDTTTNSVIFSQTISSKEAMDWNTTLRSLAFKSEQILNGHDFVMTDDSLMFSVPANNSDFTLIGSIDKNSLFSIPKNNLYLFVGCYAVLIIAVLVFFFIFKKNIYTPIIKIENVLNGISEGEINYELTLDENSQFYKMSTQINRIILHIREILDREYNENIMRKQAEINALQSQINPHFLYNVFDSLRGQAYTQNAHEIASILKSLSNLFRYTISPSSNVTLADEIAHAETYLTIQQYRFSNKFTINKSIASDPSDNILNYPIPKLILQPIVENALVHGLEVKLSTGILWLRVYPTENNLIIEVEDNGIGISPEQLCKINENLSKGSKTYTLSAENKNFKHTGIGIYNVNERLQLLYGPKYGVKIYSVLGNGTMVQIIMPRNK